MSEENMNETLSADEMTSEQNPTKSESDGPKKFGGNKWGIIGAVIVVLIAVIAGIGVYNTPENRLSRQLNLGNRYLEEQNYEQAIVEFDKAITIDPMNVDAYLGKAEAYIGLGDLQSTLDTLQTGYDLTGDERLKEKLDELQAQLNQSVHAGETVFPIEEMQVEQDYIELSFQVSDIKIMGYDLFEPHFNELVAVFGITLEQDGDRDLVSGRVNNPYGINVDNLPNPSEYDSSGILAYSEPESHRITIYTESYVGGDSNVLSSMGIPLLNYQNLYWDRFEAVIDVTNAVERNDVETICDLPIYPEDTYDDWCEKMGVKMIKNSVEMRSEEGNQYWNSIIDSQKILSEDGWYVASYWEGVKNDIYTKENHTHSYLSLMNEAGSEFIIHAEFEEQILCKASFAFYL